MPGQSFRGFAERVALVTNGANGVGRAIALQLALEGAFVITSYTEDEDVGERVVLELREMGTLAHAVKVDVSRAEGVRKLYATVEEMFGRLDLLVNHAHVETSGALDDLTEEAWDECLNRQLRSAFLCSQAAVPLMRKRPRPSIVNIVSEAGINGAGGAHYVAAQAGLIGLTRALARELAPKIRVNCVALGSSEVVGRGNSEDEALSGEATASMSQTDKLRASGTLPAPDEVARACIYLLSSDAASVTGQLLVVGGQR